MYASTSALLAKVVVIPPAANNTCQEHRLCRAMVTVTQVETLLPVLMLAINAGDEWMLLTHETSTQVADSAGVQGC